MSEFVRQARRERNLTQDELALRLGVSKSYVYQLEAGKRPLTDRMRKAIEGLTAGGESHMSVSQSGHRFKYPTEGGEGLIAPIIAEAITEFGGQETADIVQEMKEILEHTPDVTPLKSMLNALNLQALSGELLRRF